MRNLRKGFLAIEYVFLIAIIVAALMGMSVYLKRAICGKWRTAGDSFGYGRQFDPKSTIITDIITEAK